jgi:diguanylate cyclase (GGDEF)-like protein/PAS domain S-box-containing protein
VRGEWFREVLENMQLLAVVLDVAGKVTFVNPAAAELLGWTPDELVGRDWFATCVPEDESGEVRAGFDARIADGSIRRRDENHVITRGGARRLIQWSNTVLRERDGAIVGTASVGIDVTDQRELERRLWRDAREDAVTGLPNRVLLLERLAHAVERARADAESSYALLFVDLDRFKVVNDSLGHGVGDELLAAAGRRLLGTVGRSDLVARMGGDEFGVFLDGAGHERAAEVARAIQEAFTAPIPVRGHEVFTTTSIGVAMRATLHETPEDVLRDADSALNRAKALGKNRWEFFKSTMRAGAMARLRVENDLRRALARHELRLVYQPIINIRDGELVGLEALVRWDRPGQGAMSPAEFIPIAEETGLIVPIGEWVLRQACAQLAAWDVESNGVDWLVVNVNVSGRQLSAELIEQIDRAVLDAGISAARLKLEITESVIMDSPAAAADLLRRIKQRGIRICVDDFGTGYSSLGHLVRLPIDTMKIDRMFVMGMPSDIHTAEVVRSIVALAESLRLEVVAEGVETEQQRRALEKLGCAYAQGYLFAKPLEAAQVRELLKSAAHSATM